MIFLQRVSVMKIRKFMVALKNAQCAKMWHQILLLDLSVFAHVSKFHAISLDQVS
jgi:hypothetical protein